MATTEMGIPETRMADILHSRRTIGNVATVFVAACVGSGVVLQAAGAGNMDPRYFLPASNVDRALSTGAYWTFYDRYSGSHAF